MAYFKSINVWYIGVQHGLFSSALPVGQSVEFAGAASAFGPTSSALSAGRIVRGVPARTRRPHRRRSPGNAVRQTAKKPKITPHKDHLVNLTTTTQNSRSSKMAAAVSAQRATEEAIVHGHQNHHPSKRKPCPMRCEPDLGFLALNGWLEHPRNALLVKKANSHLF